MADFERSPDRRLQEHIFVSYGEARGSNISRILETRNVYSCVGVVLRSKERIALAHVPPPDPFLKRLREPYTETFTELMRELLIAIGPHPDKVEALLFGGVQGVSEQLVKRIEEVLVRNGIPVVTRQVLHSGEEEWDIFVQGGEVTISRYPRPNRFLGEGTY